MSTLSCCPRPFGDGRDWFLRSRFGLFVHWGIYAVGGLHEQEFQRYHRTWEEYDRYRLAFDPCSFHPSSWLDTMAECGMQYLVFTVKHHDGFCLWDTKETDFSVRNTPYGKDILAEVAEACHRRGVPLELYYSVVDWHHPNYPNLGRHHEVLTDPSQHDIEKYLGFVRRQMTELCTNYGELHGIWWDMNVPGLQADDIPALIHRLQPNAVLNDRGFGSGDYDTPERSWSDGKPCGAGRRREACESVGANSWGYRREEDYWTARRLEERMARFLSHGANFLLNAGPRPDGRFPPEALSALRQVGRWYRNVSEAFECPETTGLFPRESGLFACGRCKTLYVAVAQPLDCSAVSLAPLAELPARATLLNTGEQVDVTLEPNVYVRDTSPRFLRLRGFDVDSLAGEVPVFRLDFERELPQLRKALPRSVGKLPDA